MKDVNYAQKFLLPLSVRRQKTALVKDQGSFL